MDLGTITTISLDADGTLWDFEAMMRASLGVTLEEIERVTGGPSGLDVEAMIEIRDRVARRWRGEVLDLDRIRHMAFEATLEDMGAPDSALACRLNALYVAHRADSIVLYDDVLPALEALDKKFVLGVLSNGNTLPERAGIRHFFDFVVFAQDHGVAKPDPRIFEVALKEAGGARETLLHVGDSLEDDVAGAKAASVKSVWLNRTGDLNESAIRPDLEVASFTELAEILCR